MILRTSAPRDAGRLRDRVLNAELFRDHHRAQHAVGYFLECDVARHVGRSVVRLDVDPHPEGVAPTANRDG